MFTGLVEGCGTVTSDDAASGQLRLGIRPHFAWEKPLQGESVAVNGPASVLRGGTVFPSEPMLPRRRWPAPCSALFPAEMR